jgi:uncharacterized protein YraI
MFWLRQETTLSSITPRGESIVTLPTETATATAMLSVAKPVDPTSTPVAPTATPPATFTVAPSPLPTKTPTEIFLPSPNPPPTVTPSPTSPPAARVDSLLNGARTGPSTSYSLLEGAVAGGSLLDLIGRSADGGWWLLCCVDGLNGWFAASEVTVEGEPRDIPIVLPPLPAAEVLVYALNVRFGPGLDYPVMGASVQGTRLAIVARLPDYSWWQVCCLNEELGWVIGEGITILDSFEFVPVVTELPASSPPAP